MTPLYVDVIAILIFVYYFVRGYFVGLWSWVAGLITLVASLYIALLWYAPFGAFLAAHIGQLRVLPVAIQDAIGYVVILLVVQIFMHMAMWGILKSFPKIFFENGITRIVAMIPSAIQATIIVVMLVLVVSVLPIPSEYTDAINQSRTGQIVNAWLPILNQYANEFTSGRLNQALTLLTSHTESEEQPETLPFKPSQTSVDAAGEAQMLVLLNQSRAAAGLAPLSIDPELTKVAEAHSLDMWNRQYFSHISPDGADPFTRMHAAGITYSVAGENIALAATVSLAETGLMNSPGHRANILDKDFHKVGIGIISGGWYGDMVTQDFTN